ncbi:MAG TPA: hypothetical protein VND91_10415, partial [Candidatus Saccharimonadia bacterium]|nr:hypothetical protein [Candidatus Saccharimonadia bacterium]
MAGSDEHAPLYAAIDGQVAAISSHECVFRDPRSGASHLLPIAAVEALDACRAFAPLALHAQRLAERQPQLPSAAIAQGLEALRSRRLLQDDREFLAPRAAVAEPRAALRAIFIRACDRPAQLRRLFESLAANEALHRAGHRYVVLDDSKATVSTREHAQLTASFARDARVQAIHLGGESRAAVAARLGAPAPAAARAALGHPDPANTGFGGGTGYNLAALLGAGSAY